MGHVLRTRAPLERPLPVLITAPGPSIGPLLAARVARSGGEVRAFCSENDPVALLRQSGAFCAVGSLVDEGHLERAMERVHTVVHIGRGFAVPPEVLVEEAATIISAAVGAEVRRIVLLSVPGAGVGDRLRLAAGEVEALVADGPFESVVLRVSLVDTPALRELLGAVPSGQLAAQNVVAPVAPDRLAELLAAFDDRERSLVESHDTFGADGPSTTTLGALTVRTAPPLAIERHVMDALAGPWTSRELPSAWAAAGVSPA